MESAKGIFDRNCAMCHGNSGLGVTNTFPNLMDGVWQWGASITNIEQTIRNGRRAVMPGWDSSLNSNQIDQLAEFLQSLSSGIIIPDSDPGRLIYSQLCFSCHGTEGKGNINIGAPSLVDTVWLYGKSDDDLTETIRNGRNGTMPGFYNKLDDVQIRLLLAWLSR
ncbi:MAG: c-type cytochrome [Gammaproteobacteria bacterium]